MARTATPADEESTVRSGRRTGLDREDVVAAAHDLVEREGAGALSMRRLATVLDVATPTIYWHVNSRDELVAAVIRLQSTRLAEQPVEGTTHRDRVFSAARHIWTSSIEHRGFTSLAHQTGMSALLLHHLEAALLVELEAAGLRGPDAADASRAILITVGGSLLHALRDHSTYPAEFRPDALWADSKAPIAYETRTALRTDADLDELSAVALRAVINHYIQEQL